MLKTRSNRDVTQLLTVRPMVRDTMNRSASLRAHRLTASQATMLKELWPGLDHYELGAELYRLIFEQSPSIMNLFPSVVAGGGPVDDNDDFIKQVAFLIDFFTEAILICDEQSAMATFAQTAGRKQVTETGWAAQAGHGHNIRPEYWATFRSSMKTAMTKHLLRDGLVSAGERCTLVQAWCTLTSVIINEMRQTFQLEQMSKQSPAKVEEGTEDTTTTTTTTPPRHHNGGGNNHASVESRNSLEIPDRASIDWGTDGGGGASAIGHLDRSNPRSASMRCKQRVFNLLGRTFSRGSSGRRRGRGGEDGATT